MYPKSETENRILCPCVLVNQVWVWSFITLNNNNKMFSLKKKNPKSKNFIFHMSTEDLFGILFVMMVSLSLKKKRLFNMLLNGALEWGERNLSSSRSSVTNQLFDLEQVTLQFWVSPSLWALCPGWQRLSLWVSNAGLIRILWNEHTKSGAPFT